RDAELNHVLNDQVETLLYSAECLDRIVGDLLDLVRVGNLPEVAPINDPATARVPLEAAPFTANFAAGTGYTRNLQMVRQDTNPANYGYLLFEVTVNLYWESKGVEHSVTLKGLHRAP
ncbi:MAG: hypothetical protein KC910_20420, partial [Candidatus Eremiobacteraeota bacterium]|nr:hypothetical protein [Candidatus Eremiobacteraeota bacterium]